MPGDVLMNEGGDLDKLGRGAIWGGDLSPIVHQNHVFVVRCKKGILPEFLNAWTSGSASRRYFLVAGKQTTNLASINKSSLGGLPIALPCPSEQQKIAEALNELDSLIQSLNELTAKKRDIKQAAMQELLTGKRRLPGFEGEWEEVQLGNIASIRNARVVASSMPPDTKCIELDCIDQGTGRLLTSSYATGAGTKYTFKRGDVLFGRLRAYLRKFWLASFDGICSTEIWPLIARDNRLSAGFLHLLVQSNSFVDAAGVSYGTHMPRSDWSVLRKFQLKLPPVDEQVAIATLLSDMDAELAALEARRSKTRALKQAMMQELLTGRIRLR
jgi:type I restriction enzyme S subunit